MDKRGYFKITLLAGAACAAWLALCGAGLAQTISVTLGTPNGGESWEAGSTHNITWESSGTPESVNLYYTLNNGASFTTIATATLDAHSYAWTVPGASTNEALVSIEAVKAADIATAESAAPFTIYDDIAPVVTVGPPDGGEKLVGGSAESIGFTATDVSGLKVNSLYIWYSVDNGNNWNNLVTSDAAVSSPYAWRLPTISTTEVRVAIRVNDNSANHNAGTGYNADKFTIDSTAPTVSLGQPNAGASLTGGSPYTITWTATDECGLAANPITLRYSTDKGITWTQIAANQPNSGSYSWPSVPYIVTNEARVSVEAVNQVGLTGTAMSSGDFTILSDFQGPVITVEAPSGNGYIWKGGTTHPITFEASDPSGLKLTSLSVWYSTDNGTTYTNQVNGAATSSPYNWAVPSSISTTEVKVRLQLADNSPNYNIGTGESAAKFTIDSTAPLVTVSQPNGFESLSGNNATYEVKWVATDECGLPTTPITLRYSTDGGGTWTLIATNEANDGSYFWTVPHVNTSNGRVSVEATNLVGMVGADMSNNDFNISSDATGPTVTVETPVNGDVWRGGSTHLITFETTDLSGINPNRFSIYYSINAGSSFPYVITSEATFSPPSPYSYSWTVPTDINTRFFKIRVTARDIYDNLGTGESTGSCTVDSTAPTVSISSPTGGEKWQGGVNHNISWSASDVTFGLKTDPITLQYSTNGGTGWTEITSEAANSPPYTWSVPSSDTSQAKVRVIAEDAAGNTGLSTSAAFTIDSTPPSTPNPLTQLTGTATNTAYPYFSWSAATDNLSGISSYEITVDTTVTTLGAVTNYTQPTSLEGYHTWEVRAQDGAGIWSAYSTRETFNIILTAPSISGITLKDTATGSTLYTKAQLVTLEASGVGGTGQMQMIMAQNSAFNLNSTGWLAYLNPTTYLLNSGQGSKTVYYKVRDAALNESTFESASITLDTIIPSVVVTAPNGGENLGGGLNYTINWSASDTGVGLTATPITIRFSHDGGGNWEIVASNEANGGSYSWVVPNGIDSTTCLISIEAIDLAGNVWVDKSDGAFTIISVGPQTPTLSSPINGNYVNVSIPKLQWEASSNAVSYECVIDGTTAATVGATSYWPDNSLVEGNHTWEVRARNAANLWSAGSGTGSFNIDVIGPTPSIDTFSDNNNPQPTFNGRVVDNYKVSSAEARIDTAAWRPVTAVDGSFNSTSEAFSFSAPALLARGTHTLEVRAYDAAGNQSSSNARLTFVITKSTVTYDVKMGGTAVTTGTVIPFRPTFSVTFNSPLEVVDFKVYIDNQSLYTHTGSFTSETVAITPFTDLAVGAHTLRATTQNVAGDVFTKEVTGLTVISDVRVFMTAGASTISLAVNTSSSGPATLILRRPNGQTILQKTIPDLGDAAQITIDKYIAGENLKGPYLWKLIYNGGRSSKSGGFIVP